MLQRRRLDHALSGYREDVYGLHLPPELRCLLLRAGDLQREPPPDAEALLRASWTKGGVSAILAQVAKKD